MNRIIAAILVFVGVIHLLPLAGVLGSDQLSKLYGISFEESNIEILMRHRAILFGLLGGFLVFAAFNKAYHLTALVVGLISVSSFLLISWSVGGYNAQIARVCWADLLALLCIALGFVFHYLRLRGPS